MHRYHVHEMNCGHCAAKIEQAVKGVDPGAEVRADVATRQVVVRSGVEDARIVAAIRGAGYEAETIAAIG